MIREFTRIEPLHGARVRLPRADVHIHYGILPAASDELDRFERCLSQPERERASRFRFARDRDRYVFGRGSLRRILASYLCTSPDEVAFRYGAAGKPELARPGSENVVRFNLSHSGDVVLVAVAQDREVGVDVEAVRGAAATDGVAARFFHPAEVASLAALENTERSLAFYRFWTRKEAYLKARGDGLGGGLAALDTCGLAASAAQPIRFADPLSGGRSWWVFDLDLAPGYAAAVVVAD